MRPVPLALAAALILPLATAQDGGDGARCGSYAEATAWWDAQAARVRALAGAAPELVAFHASHADAMRLDKLGERRAGACWFLEAVAQALERPDDPREGALRLRAAAAAAASVPDLGVRPLLLQAADLVGARLADQAEATASTSARIGLLQELSTLYREAGAEGPRAEADLWLGAEAAAWDADKARVAADAAAAERLLGILRGPMGNALYVASMPELVGRLEADRGILASHGDGPEEQAQAEVVDASLERLRGAQAGAVQRLLGSSLAIMAGAVVVVLAARRPLRAMESDVHEVLVALHGVAR